MSFHSPRSGPRSILHKYISLQYGRSPPKVEAKLLQARSQILRAACFYHPNQRITNFCKNYSCLFPMCPKCVKQHSEEHAQMGTSQREVGVHGDFDTIQNCMEQAESSLAEMIDRAYAASSRAEQVNEACRIQSDRLRKEFSGYKQKIMSALHDSLSRYEEQLERMIGRVESQLASELQRTTTALNHMVASSTHFLENLYGNNILDNLVMFFSATQLRHSELLEQCERTIEKATADKIVMLEYPDNIDVIRSNLNSYLHLQLLEESAVCNNSSFGQTQSEASCSQSKPILGDRPTQPPTDRLKPRSAAQRRYQFR